MRQLSVGELERSRAVVAAARAQRLANNRKPRLPVQPKSSNINRVAERFDTILMEHMRPR